jgi:SET domain-containing protein
LRQHVDCAGRRGDFSAGIVQTGAFAKAFNRSADPPVQFVMTVVSKRKPSRTKPYRVGRSRTGLGLFATGDIEKGTRIVEYFGPLLDCSKPKDDAIENKYLFELNGRWTIDGSVRRNIARYANHSCRPNAESDVFPRKKKVYIKAIKKIRPGDEITYDYGTDYFREYLKPIGCLCVSCVAKRKAARAEERAKKKRARARQEKREAKRALAGANGANGHANGHAPAAKKSRRTTSAARH